jgi:hypothetical protein
MTKEPRSWPEILRLETPGPATRESTSDESGLLFLSKPPPDHHLILSMPAAMLATRPRGFLMPCYAHASRVQNFPSPHSSLPPSTREAAGFPMRRRSMPDTTRQWVRAGPSTVQDMQDREVYQKIARLPVGQGAYLILRSLWAFSAPGLYTYSQLSRVHDRWKNCCKCTGSTVARGSVPRESFRACCRAGVTLDIPCTCRILIPSRFYPRGWSCSLLSLVNGV